MTAAFDAGEARAMASAALTRLADTASAGVGGLLDWLTPIPKTKPVEPLPYQGPSPEGVALLIMRVAAELSLSDDALDIASARLREGGYHAEAHNFGAQRCMLVHEHGGDARCIACTDPNGKASFLRCFGSDDRALRQLLLVARARAKGGPIAPPCPSCRVRQSQPAQQGGWAPCRPCAFALEAERRQRVESDPAFTAIRKEKEKLREAFASKPWFRGIGIGADEEGSATLELRVNKLTPKIRRAVPTQVRDENGAFIDVRVEAVGDIYAQTELGGYRSMEEHAKAPPVREGETAGPLDDLGRGDELGDWVGAGAQPTSASIDPAPDQTARELVEDKVHELAAAWAAIREQMVRSPTVAAALGPLHDRWDAFWQRYRQGAFESADPPDDLVDAIDATNQALAGAEAEQAKAELAALKARAQTHNGSVREALETPIREEPEFVEYAKRWKAWVDRLKEAEERHESKVQWLKELAPYAEAARLSEVRLLATEYNELRDDWNGVKNRISLRRGEAQIKTLQEGIDATKKVRAGTATEEEQQAALKAFAEQQRIEKAKATGQSATVPEMPATRGTAAPAPPPSAGPSLNIPFLGQTTTAKLVGLGAAATVAVLVALRSLLTK